MKFKRVRNNKTCILLFGLKACVVLFIYTTFVVLTLETKDHSKDDNNILNSDVITKRFKMATSSVDTSLWPEERLDSDRIRNQLNFKPRWITDHIQTTVKSKKILLYHGRENWEIKAGRTTFLNQNCPVTKCELTWNRNDLIEADAVLFRNVPIDYRKPELSNQIWIYFTLESPYNTRTLKNAPGLFNWTATYRHDSDIVAPYEKFQLFDEHVKTQPQNRSYASGKPNKVAWFVSKCQARNRRLEYAQELSKYIQVDIYGECGDLKCQKGDDECFEMLRRDYKFYLAFENSNCRDYITEKFFTNGLQ